MSSTAAGRPEDAFILAKGPQGYDGAWSVAMQRKDAYSFRICGNRVKAVQRAKVRTGKWDTRSMYYQLYEFNHAAMAPWHAMADQMRLAFRNPLNPLAHTYLGRTMAAGFEVLERTTRRYGKPEFGLAETVIDGKSVSVHEKIVWKRPFCNLIHFERCLPAGHRKDPKILVVAPMSGH